jgi:hypothetical protein
MDEKLATFLSTLREPRYSSAAHDPKQPIVLKGVLNGESVEFFASPTDAMDYGRELHRRAAVGELGRIGAYISPPERDTVKLLKAQAKGGKR